MNQKKGVFSFNFSHSKLSSIPKEVMKNKDSLTQLDISGNNFTDFHSVLEDLKQLKKLKKLRINIYTQEQAKDIIDSMPNLEFLNDEPINEEISEEEEFNKEEEEEEDKEIIINIPLIKLADKTFEPVFKQFQEFYNINKEKNEEFQKIIENFNDCCKQLNISENNNNDNDNNLEDLSVSEINNKLKLYMFLNDILIKIKEEINSGNNEYNQNSINILLKIIEENEKIKNKCNLILLNKQSNINTNNNITSNISNISNGDKINKVNIQKNKIVQRSKNINNKNKINPKNDQIKKNKYYSPPNAYNISKNKSKNLSKKPSYPSYQNNPKNKNKNKNIFISNTLSINGNKKNNNEYIVTNRSFNKKNEKFCSPRVSDPRAYHTRSPLSERADSSRRSHHITSNNNNNKNGIKKYSKQVYLIESYNDPSITNLLIKNRPDNYFDPNNIFDDNNNEQIYKNKLNTRIIKLNNLLEIINQIYKIRNSRIEKQKQEEGIYKKATLEQDLYTYLKSKYGLKKLIIEWNINILSSIKSYFKLNGEVYLFALILKNELDEDSIEIVDKIKKTVYNILYLIYDYDVNLVENIKQNKDFLRENEWKTISKCLYSDDNNLRQKFVNKVSNYIDKIMKGQELLAKTGQKILLCDYMNLLINFNLKLRKNYLHNLYVLFSQYDKKKTGIINLDNFKSIIKNCGIITDEQKAEEVANDLIEIADKDGTGQITFNDTVQCLDNLDLVMNEGKVKFLDKLSKMNFDVEGVITEN